MVFDREEGMEGGGGGGGGGRWRRRDQNDAQVCFGLKYSLLPLMTFLLNQLSL